MNFLKKIYKRGGILNFILPLAGNRLALYLYRLSHFLYKIYIPELPYVIQYINAIINGCEIHYRAEIGRNFKISHSRGVVIGSKVILGDNVVIYSNVVLGKKNLTSDMPKIGNNVIIGANAVVIGGITIGNNCKIGANSLVNKSFRDGMLIAGNSASEITKDV